MKLNRFRSWLENLTIVAGFVGLLCVAQLPVAGQDPTPSPSLTPPVSELVLDRNEVRIPCPPWYGKAASERCEDSFLISVSFVGKEIETGAEYNYTANGGKILGNGMSVTWDLGGVPPGTYTITLTIQTSAKVVSGITRATVTVANCPCPDRCECPRLDVTGPASAIGRDEKAMFAAVISDGSARPDAYHWTVKNGKIIGGQDTSSIEVLPNISAKDVTAIVEIRWADYEGGYCASICPFVASETVSVRQVIMGRVISVQEGDAIVIADSQKKRFLIRLAGIDAPELKQAFGEQSRQNLSAFVLGKEVRVEVMATGAGRVYAKVLLSGRDINLAQLKAGYAWHYKQPQGLTLEDDQHYDEAEKEARAGRSNLWSEKNSTPPWEFREEAPRKLTAPRKH